MMESPESQVPIRFLIRCSCEPLSEFDGVRSFIPRLPTLGHQSYLSRTRHRTHYHDCSTPVPLSSAVATKYVPLQSHRRLVILFRRSSRFYTFNIGVYALDTNVALSL